jgi:chemosensory pili system protein ChpA (sensor histidine kinase/response regulator)
MTGDTGIHEQMIGDDKGRGAVSALAIINTELMETIRNAQLALEDCVDGRGGSAALTRTGELLHQAVGALRMTETYGAALLVEEMELTSSFLSGLRSGKGREDGLDALTRSMVQLPIYIERLLGGGRDIALVLLPMLNDLRAARGEPLLSEGTLLLLNLSPKRSQDKSGKRKGSGEDPLVVAKRLRPKFQLALLGWIKGGDTKRPLETLARVAAALEHSSTRDDMYQLWWVIGGVLESLQNGGLQTSVALKRLLGQADRQLKYVIDEGLNAYETHPIDDLLNNLLYYVARSSSAGERISDIRAAFNLAELLPGDEQVESAREALSAPSAKLMETVGSAIREDLGRVKDVLDIFVRTGMNKSSELVPQLELLKKISDTLGVLGLGELRGDIDGEIDRLKSVVELGGVANDRVILDIASTLLRVEDRLEQQLIRLTMPVADVDEEGAPEDDEEFRKVAESVMRECIINLARIKETISQSIAAQAPSAGLDNVPSLIQGIKAGLLMLDKTRAMEVVDRIGSLVTAMLNAGGSIGLTQKETDRLADAIVSIEYYMETVKAGRSEPWYMLDNAEACLAVLRDVEQRMLETKFKEPAQTPDTTQKLEPLDVEAAGQRAAAEAAANELQMQATEVMPLPVVAPDAEHLDPELLEIFIEEAKQEISSINRHLPSWVQSPDDMEMLITVRRSFHTLKGSGRMVGAERIGEYAWAVENLLNRLINRTLARTPPMVEFVMAAAAAVPELVEQLEVGAEPQSDISLLIARANAFAEGDPNAAVLTISRPASGEPTEDELALEMDPVLHDIFSKETAGHLKVIMDYLEACEGHEPPFDVTDKLHRACHTLHGSANMANVDRGVAVAAALNRFVRHVYDHKIGFQRSGLDALRAASRAINTIVGDINNPARDRADYTALIDHITRLTNAAQVAPLTAAPPKVAAPPAAVPAPAPVVEDVVEDAEYDAEIAAIFTEESAELLESADKALIEWIKERSAQPMEELKRHLHTLKGGARMAGITSMGNLSHEIETLLISVDDGRVKATPNVEDLLQRAIDELHRMRDLVIAGKPVRSAAELEQRIQQANAGFEVADDVDVELEPDDTRVEEAPSAEFTIEPEDTVSMVIVDSPLADELAEIGKEQEARQPALEAEPEPEPSYRRHRLPSPGRRPSYRPRLVPRGPRTSGRNSHVSMPTCLKTCSTQQARSVFTTHASTSK